MSTTRRPARREVAPIPRLSLIQSEAAEALGVSVDYFVEHIQTDLRCVRRGRKRLFPVRELERWLDAEAERVSFDRTRDR